MWRIGSPVKTPESKRVWQPGELKVVIWIFPGLQFIASDQK